MEELPGGTTRTLVSGPYYDMVPSYNVLSYSALSPDGLTLADSPVLAVKCQLSATVPRTCAMH